MIFAGPNLQFLDRCNMFWPCVSVWSPIWHFWPLVHVCYSLSLDMSSCSLIFTVYCLIWYFFGPVSQFLAGYIFCPLFNCPFLEFVALHDTFFGPMLQFTAWSDIFWPYTLPFLALYDTFCGRICYSYWLSRWDTSWGCLVQETLTRRGLYGMFQCTRWPHLVFTLSRTHVDWNPWQLFCS